MANISLPTYTTTVDQKFFLEPIGGPVHPENYLDRFPDEVYNKSPDAHWVRFIYSLLGPAGAGWLKKNFLDARLVLIDHGFEVFDLERYYGDPFRFPRLVAENYDKDPTGLLTRQEWDLIKAKDEQYRSRALDFFGAARAGSSPLGMRLAARSGINHEVEIIEAYKYLFDLHSDEPRGFTSFGHTRSTSEFVVLPRLEVSRSEIQKVSITGFPTDGFFTLIFRGRATTPIDYAASVLDVQTALEALATIGPDNVEVTDGPEGTVAPLVPTSFPPFLIRFTGDLSNQDIPPLEVIDSLEGGVNATVTVTTERGGKEAVDEVVTIDSQVRHNLQTALDHLRPVNSLPTIASARGLASRQAWLTVHASSEYQEVIRYVTGTKQVVWPALSPTHWIEQGVEKAGPRVHDDRQYHYQEFHGIQVVTAYTEAALADPQYASDASVLKSYPSLHIGNFDPIQASIFPVLKANYGTTVFTADRILADYPQPLTVTTQDYSVTQETSPSPLTATSFINGIYPADYASLSGVPALKYGNEDQFWASRERTEGADIVEIDLGTFQAVNFLAFDIIGKPLDIEVAYDTIGDYPRRNFAPVTPVDRISFPTSVTYAPANSNPWNYLEFVFADGRNQMIYTRFLRLTFTRRLTPDDLGNRFLYNTTTQVQSPFSIEVRNLRAGRNVV